MKVIGLICSRDGFGWTVVDTATRSAEDHSIEVPGNLTDRGEQLRWLLDEATRVLEGERPAAMRIQGAQKGRFGASPERHEVEGVMQVAASVTGTPYEMLTRDQVRAALGVAREAGAYEKLLKRADVRARSNKERRDQYLLAWAASGQLP